mgnify:CR=1 FL=1
MAVYFDFIGEEGTNMWGDEGVVGVDIWVKQGCEEEGYSRHFHFILMLEGELLVYGTHRWE